ncbi:sugar transferase [Piscinibacter sakaiensis]|uniref:sugar transferase n=1 Tax=Piscinibacter sakaiensis TaxID=1547922 RepID=UPI003AAA298E
MLKRFIDIVGSGFGLVLLWPVFLGVAIAIKLDSPGPVFFRQTRIGRNCVPFRIHKFRSMVCDAEMIGLRVTSSSDPRVTNVGAFLRRTKIDELPQLLDVLFGSMSLVGPRPEVPEYVDLYSECDRAIVFSVRPGITDLASIQFKDEASILGAAVDPHKAYVDEVLPAKIQYYKNYVHSRTTLGDLRILRMTIFSLLLGRSRA